MTLPSGPAEEGAGAGAIPGNCRAILQNKGDTGNVWNPHLPAYPTPLPPPLSPSASHRPRSVTGSHHPRPEAHLNSELFRASFACRLNYPAFGPF